MLAAPADGGTSITPVWCKLPFLSAPITALRWDGRLRTTSARPGRGRRHARPRQQKHARGRQQPTRVKPVVWATPRALGRAVARLGYSPRRGRWSVARRASRKNCLEGYTNRRERRGRDSGILAWCCTGWPSRFTSSRSEVHRGSLRVDPRSTALLDVSRKIVTQRGPRRSGAHKDVSVRNDRDVWFKRR